MKPSQKQIDKFLAQKKIALAGYSRSHKKFGNLAYRTLSQNGYDVIPINPNGGVVSGSEKNICANVKQLPDDVNAILIIVHKEKSAKIVEEAKSKGIENIWVQQMCENQELKTMAKDDVKMILGQCILLHVNPKGIHKFHRNMAGLFGLLPK